MDFRKGFGQLNQTASLSSSLNSSLNSSINISSAMGAGGYQHYGLNALGEATCAPFFSRFVKELFAFLNTQINILLFLRAFLFPINNFK